LCGPWLGGCNTRYIRRICPSVCLVPTVNSKTENCIRRSNLEKRLPTSGVIGKASSRSKGQRSRSLGTEMEHIFEKNVSIHVNPNPGWQRIPRCTYRVLIETIGRQCSSDDETRHAGEVGNMAVYWTCRHTTVPTHHCVAGAAYRVAVLRHTTTWLSLRMAGRACGSAAANPQISPPKISQNVSRLILQNSAPLLYACTISLTQCCTISKIQ